MVQVSEKFVHSQMEWMSSEREDGACVVCDCHRSHLAMASMVAVQFRWFSSSFFRVAYDQREFEKERERRRGIREIIPLTFWRAYFGGHLKTASFGGFDNFFFFFLM